MKVIFTIALAVAALGAELSAVSAQSYGGAPPSYSWSTDHGSMVRGGHSSHRAYR